MNKKPNYKLFDKVYNTYLHHYTLVFLDELEGKETFNCYNFSCDPTHPQGVGQHSCCKLGGHLGEEMAINRLPKRAKEHIKNYLGNR